MLMPKKIKHRKQHRGRIVVDHGGRFSSGQFADELVDQIVAIAALAGVEIEFEVGGLRERLHDGLHGLVGQQCTAEVGMQHGAGQIENATQARLVALAQRGFY